jgi:hypothetical protein
MLCNLKLPNPIPTQKIIFQKVTQWNLSFLSGTQVKNKCWQMTAAGKHYIRQKHNRKYKLYISYICQKL